MSRTIASLEAVVVALSAQVAELVTRIEKLEKVSPAPRPASPPAPCGVCGKRGCGGHTLCPVCNVPLDHKIRVILGRDEKNNPIYGEAVRKHGMITVDGVKKPCPKG